MGPVGCWGSIGAVCCWGRGGTGSGRLLGSGPELGGGAAVPWNSPKSSSAAVKQSHKTHSRHLHYHITEGSLVTRPSMTFHRLLKR